MARALSATAVATPQPHSQSRTEKSRPPLRSSRRLISTDAGSIAMGSSIAESLKTLTESAKCRFCRLSRCPGVGLLRVSGLGYGMRHSLRNREQYRMSRRSSLAIVLAAGEGTRMRSRTPKVMHQLGGLTLLAHVMGAVRSAGTRDIAIVVGPEHDTVRAEVQRIAPEAQIFQQRTRRGTAHAVLSARKAIARGADDILIIFGDTPLVRPETLKKLRGALADGAAVAVLGFRPADPT